MDSNVVDDLTEKALNMSELQPPLHTMLGDTSKMNFDGFVKLIRRVVFTWFDLAKKSIINDEWKKKVEKYLKLNPNTAPPTDNNKWAYETLMDVRMKLEEISFEIDRNHDAYMEFVMEVSNSPDLVKHITDSMSVEESNLLMLELMIMEQVYDWEEDVRDNNDVQSRWLKSNRIVVTLPSGKTSTLLFEKKLEPRYFFSMCPVTYKIGQIKVCTGCKTVGYADKDSQKNDWSNHKTLCKVLQDARKNNITNEDKLRNFMSQSLNRQLTQFEEDVINFPRLPLHILMSSDPKDKMEKWMQCKMCHSQTFDNEMEMKQHEDSKCCRELKKTLLDYKYEMVMGHRVQTYQPKVFESDSTYTPIQETNGETIESFFRPFIAPLISDASWPPPSKNSSADDRRHLMENPTLSGVKNVSAVENDESYLSQDYQSSELRYLTFLYTCPLTVLHGLEKAYGEELVRKTSLTLDIVGCRLAEMRHLVGWEMIPCRLPNLKNLKLNFIGDELTASSFPSKFYYKSSNLQCEKGASNDVMFERLDGLKIEYSFHYEKLYQDYHATEGIKEDYSKPDAVVALDCGFKFYPTWSPFLQLLATTASLTSVPLIFTEFTLPDQKDNLGLIQSIFKRNGKEVDIILHPQINPFSATKPSRTSDKSGSYESKYVVYTNDFICVIR